MSVKGLEQESPTSGKAVASSFGRNTLDVWLLTSQLQKHLPWVTTPRFCLRQESLPGCRHRRLATGVWIRPQERVCRLAQTAVPHVSTAPHHPPAPPHEHEAWSPKSWLHVPARPFQSHGRL